MLTNLQIGGATKDHKKSNQSKEKQKKKSIPSLILSFFQSTVSLFIPFYCFKFNSREFIQGTNILKIYKKKEYFIQIN